MVGSKRNESGFSLIELMVVVAIIGILAMVAYPSYMDSIRKSRRADAMAGLSAVQLAQEKYRANHVAFTNAVADLGVSATSPDGYYAISITANTATTYTVLANAVAGMGQDRDGVCSAISVNQDGLFNPLSCVSR